MPDPETPADDASSLNRMRTGRNPKVEAAIGARIRAARIAVRMGQTELGRLLGFSYQQVQKYETGKDRVSASSLQGLAVALGVHPGSFYGDDMPALAGDTPDVRSAMRIANRIQRIRNPVVVKRLMALVDLLAGTEGEAGDKGAVQVEQEDTNG